MVKKILFITEGKNPDRNLVRSVCKFQNNIQKNPIIEYEITIYSTNIYVLYQDLIKYQFVQIVDLIREKEGEKFPYSSEDFSLIYLFFDLDMHHHTPESDFFEIKSQLESMFDTFDDETENGKLFLSYPMAEANQYFHEKFITDQSVSFYTFPIFSPVHFKDVCKSFIRKNGAIQTRMLDSFLIWNYLIDYTSHILKFLGIDIESMDASIDSKEVFINQFNKFINQPTSEVILLSAFPQYLLHVYGIQKLLEENQIKILQEGLTENVISILDTEEDIC
ncbi:hypothetical protein [Streptococcus suis]|uniref:hypothetical protein n=1 Tax=Streptococcus suis TaxID=1307 RepID=UPI000C1A3CEC|nr:hypothetical protein [Streptococcus suis]